MSRGLVVTTLVSVAFCAALDVGPVGAQQPIVRPMAPVATVGPVAAAPAGGPTTYLNINWGDTKTVAASCTPSTRSCTTPTWLEVYGWSCNATQAVAPSAQSAAVPGQSTPVLTVTLPNDQAVASVLQRMGLPGQVAEVAVVIRAANGQVQRPCVIPRAAMTQWSANGGQGGVHPQYQATFAGTS